jgi:hypothetical protein
VSAGSVSILSHLTLCKAVPVLNWLPRHKDVLECGGIAPRILTSALDWGGLSASRPGRFTYEKEPRYPLNMRLCVPQSWSGRGGWGKKSHTATKYKLYVANSHPSDFKEPNTQSVLMFHVPNLMSFFFFFGFLFPEKKITQFWSPLKNKSIKSTVRFNYCIWIWC